MNADALAIGGMMFELIEQDALPLAFDKKLWDGTIDRVTVFDEQVSSIPVQGRQRGHNRMFHTFPPQFLSS